MTENEQLERERNWVKARFDCSVDAVFKELVAVIESDIGLFNKLSGKDDCAVSHIGDGNVTFSRNKCVVSISADGKTIKAGLKHGESQLSDLEIRPKWNPVEMHCDLFIDGDKVSTNFASQKIIGDVLFSRPRTWPA